MSFSAIGELVRTVETDLWFLRGFLAGGWMLLIIGLPGMAVERMPYSYITSCSYNGFRKYPIE